MVALSYLNGNKTKTVVKGKKKRWEYADGKPVGKDGKIEYRPCPKCGGLPTEEGHDACLRKLPGVKSACCGHGVRAGYIAFENGVRITLGKYSVITRRENGEEKDD